MDRSVRKNTKWCRCGRESEELKCDKTGGHKAIEIQKGWELEIEKKNTMNECVGGWVCGCVGGCGGVGMGMGVWVCVWVCVCERE